LPMMETCRDNCRIFQTNNITNFIGAAIIQNAAVSSAFSKTFIRYKLVENLLFELRIIPISWSFFRTLNCTLIPAGLMMYMFPSKMNRPPDVCHDTGRMAIPNEIRSGIHPMQIKNVHLVYFSPTGTIKQLSGLLQNILARKFGNMT